MPKSSSSSSSVRSINNPFKKKRRIQWIQYLICIIVLWLLWRILFASNRSSNDSNNGSQHLRQQQHNLQDVVEKARLKELAIKNAATSETTTEEDLNGHDDVQHHNDDGGDDDKRQQQTNDDQEIGKSTSFPEINNNNNRDDRKKLVVNVGVDEHNKPYRQNQRKEEEEEGDYEYDEEFPSLSQSEFSKWLSQYYKKLQFTKHTEVVKETKKLTRSMLKESLTLGCNNIANNQQTNGNFNYQYDFITHKMDTTDSPVRQAGALWGISLCLQTSPNNRQWQSVVENGIDFFISHMTNGPTTGSKMIQYPGQTQSESGVNALFGLAVIDYLRTVRDYDVTVDLDKVHTYELQLASTINFLKYMQKEEEKGKHFASYYSFDRRRKSKSSSPYYDGEVMLCLVKAARYIDGFSILVPLIEQTAPIFLKEYTVDEWHEAEHDSDETKGFYQWSSMFAHEYYYAKWKDYHMFGDYVIVMAHWIIHTHEILRRKRNTGYAFEGIISAYDIAKRRNHEEAIADLEYTIDEGLYQLGRWQVGGPLARTNPFLVSNPTTEQIAIGGIMNAINESPLRIDTTQHQMHAVMMALTSVYKE